MGVYGFRDRFPDVVGPFVCTWDEKKTRRGSRFVLQVNDSPASGGRKGRGAGDQRAEQIETAHQVGTLAAHLAVV